MSNKSNSLFKPCFLEADEFTREDPKINQYDDRIKPHEQRVLNFLVNEYLMQHNYKLTSITFADENENQVNNFIIIIINLINLLININIDILQEKKHD